MMESMLRNVGIVMNVKKIRRLKREYGLSTRIRRRRPYSGLPTSANANVPNVLARDFVTPLPDHVYSTDMTYLFCKGQQKAYLSATKDLATNEIVSYQLMRKPSVSHFVDEFRSLLACVPEASRKGLIVHSDQGFQYTHEAFRNLLKEYKVTQSMSRRGNCLDNAPIESFFGHFKDWVDVKECGSFEEVAVKVKETIDFYNHERPQQALNKKPPAVYRGLISGL